MLNHGVLNHGVLDHGVFNHEVLHHGVLDHGVAAQPIPIVTLCPCLSPLKQTKSSHGVIMRDGAVAGAEAAQGHEAGGHVCHTGGRKISGVFPGCTSHESAWPSAPRRNLLHSGADSF